MPFENSRDDNHIAELITAISKDYRNRIQDGADPVHAVRMETIRRLELTVQSIKGLMKPKQMGLFDWRGK